MSSHLQAISVLNKKFSVDKIPNVSGYTQINHNGQESLAAYQTNQEGWNLVYGVPTNVAFSPLHKLSLLLRVSFISILSLALFFYMVRHQKYFTANRKAYKLCKNVPEFSNVRAIK
ncbi:hypothetical protein F6Y05_14625 [Bacillus megaterium]|nr:hypothetical protein [Priestia megaterium]